MRETRTDLVAGRAARQVGRELGALLLRDGRVHADGEREGEAADVARVVLRVVDALLAVARRHVHALGLLVGRRIAVALVQVR
jgi:hypothetical protein